MSPITDPFLLEQRMRQFQANMIGHIAEHGQSIVGVFPAADDTDDEPGFTYTVGMTANEPPLPEFLVFFLDPKLAQNIFNDLCDLQRKSPRGPGYYGDIFAGLTAALVRVEPPNADRYIVQAHNLFGDGPIEVLQLVWPAMDGRFPWDPGYSLDPQLQPVLGTPPVRP